MPFVGDQATIYLVFTINHAPALEIFIPIKLAIVVIQILLIDVGCIVHKHQHAEVNRMPFAAEIDPPPPIRHGFNRARSGHKAAKIIGSALIIDNTGYSTTEPKLATVDPTKPGQLSYIDGCSNTNLIDPLRNGDPCINYLHFPPGIDQTWHTHPSYRIGYVISGSGHACVKESGMEHQYPLRVGRMFILHRHALHRFVTTIDSMSLMVYHPDSEDGPRDENNPMKARTYLQR